MTRREFLKIFGLGVFGIFILPLIKRLNLFRGNISHTPARYYKTLAG